MALLMRVRNVVRTGFWIYLIAGFLVMSLAGLIAGAYTLLVITVPGLVFSVYQFTKLRRSRVAAPN